MEMRSLILKLTKIKNNLPYQWGSEVVAYRLDQFRLVKLALLLIIQRILHVTTKSSVHLNIRSTKKYSNTSSHLWFYVKVTTGANATKDIFRDLCGTCALYKLLQELEKTEDESHLCIQYPAARPRIQDIGGGDSTAQNDMVQSQEPVDGEDNVPDQEMHGTLQQNLKLENGQLVVHHEMFKDEQSENFVIHLRVHSSLIDMLKCCKQMHNIMFLLKIFRPKRSVSFYMKVGEVQSHTDFSIQHWNDLHTSHRIVTDTSFLTNGTGWNSYEPRITPYVGGPVFVSYKYLTKDNLFSTTDNGPPCVLIRLINKQEKFPSPAYGGGFYGPGCVPYDPSVTRHLSLLEDIEWHEYDMEIALPRCRTPDLPYHTSVCLKTRRKREELENFFMPLFLILQPDDTSCFLHGEDVLQTFLTENRAQLIHCMETAVSKCLQPVTARKKTETLVRKCIQSTSMAIADIFNMSSNEDFKHSVLQALNLNDNADLHSELNDRLTSMSQKRHHGAWSRYKGQGYISKTAHDYGAFHELVKEEATNNKHDDLPASQSIKPALRHFNVIHTSFEEEFKADRSNKHAESHSSTVNPVTQVLSTEQGKPSPFQELAATTPSWIPRETRALVTPGITMLRQQTPQTSQALDSSISGVSDPSQNTYAFKPDLTPQIARLTQDMQAVSPFQDLVLQDQMSYENSMHCYEDPLMYRETDVEMYSQQNPCSQPYIRQSQNNNTSASSQLRSAHDIDVFENISSGKVETTEHLNRSLAEPSPFLSLAVDETGDHEQVLEEKSDFKNCFNWDHSQINTSTGSQLRCFDNENNDLFCNVMFDTERSKETSAHIKNVDPSPFLSLAMDESENHDYTNEIPLDMKKAGDADRKDGNDIEKAWNHGCCSDDVRSPVRRCHSKIDLTPDILQITQSMEGVSPFLDLAADEHTDESPNPSSAALQEIPPENPLMTSASQCFTQASVCSRQLLEAPADFKLQRSDNVKETYNIVSSPVFKPDSCLTADRLKVQIWENDPLSSQNKEKLPGTRISYGLNQALHLSSHDCIVRFDQRPDRPGSNIQTVQPARSYGTECKDDSLLLGEVSAVPSNLTSVINNITTSAVSDTDSGTKLGVDNNHVSHHGSNGVFGVSGNPVQHQERQTDSDDWFEDVLEDMDNWLH